MKETLTVALIQTDIAWEDKASNLKAIEDLIASIKEPVDLVILPEMFTTGFSMQIEQIAEEPEGATMQHMRELSRMFDVSISGSYMVKEEGLYYNRGFILRPSGLLDTQDKRHLFRIGGEAKAATPTKTRRTISFEGWNILLSICYDLRFPVWCRNINNEYDLHINVANWPEPRAEAFRTLLRARAMENLSYVVGVNRVGKDPLGLNHIGDSSAIDPRGCTLVSFDPNERGVRIAVLEREPLEKLRKKFPVWMDSDSFQIDFSAIPDYSINANNKLYE